MKDEQFNIIYLKLIHIIAFCEKSHLNPDEIRNELKYVYTMLKVRLKASLRFYICLFFPPLLPQSYVTDINCSTAPFTFNVNVNLHYQHHHNLLRVKRSTSFSLCDTMCYNNRLDRLKSYATFNSMNSFVHYFKI